MGVGISESWQALDVGMTGVTRDPGTVEMKQ